MTDPIVISEQFDVSVDKAWKALSQKEALRKWYFPVDHYELKEGSEFSFYESEHSGNYLHRCSFNKIIPMKRIEYSWAYPDHSRGISKVTWEVLPVGDRTSVKLVHSGVEHFSDAGKDFSRENFVAGWNTIVRYNLRNYLYGVEKLCFEREIRATPAAVWRTMWDEESYREWSGEFTPGSYYRGTVEKGSRIHFLGPDGNGMYSDVTECRVNELVVFRHIGWIYGHQEAPVDDETGRWTGNSESYRLISRETGTNLRVEVEAVEEHQDFFNSKLPTALKKLDEICTPK